MSIINEKRYIRVYHLNKRKHFLAHVPQPSKKSVVQTPTSNKQLMSSVVLSVPNLHDVNTSSTVSSELEELSTSMGKEDILDP